MITRSSPEQLNSREYRTIANIILTKFEKWKEKQKKAIEPRRKAFKELLPSTLQKDYFQDEYVRLRDDFDIDELDYLLDHMDTESKIKKCSDTRKRQDTDFNSLILKVPKERVGIHESNYTTMEKTYDDHLKEACLYELDSKKKGLAGMISTTDEIKRKLEDMKIDAGIEQSKILSPNQKEALIQVRKTEYTTFTQNDTTTQIFRPYLDDARELISMKKKDKVKARTFTVLKDIHNFAVSSLDLSQFNKETRQELLSWLANR